MSDRIGSIQKKRILFSPLNWGWGHVTRSIPLIHRLKSQENEIIICCSSEQEKFYRTEFPDLWYIPHDGYPFKFSGNGKWERDLLRNYNALVKFRKKEHSKLEELVDKFHPNLIISDQRYGFYSKRVRSIFITHQLRLPVSSLFSIGQLLNQKLIRQFDEVWIPDNEGSELSGQLSAINWKNKFYIGTLSRFKPLEMDNSKKTYKYLGIVSGPSPYVAIFYDELLNFLSIFQEKSVVVVPRSLKVDENVGNEHVTIVQQPDVSTLNRFFDQSETVISRAGYSTLMDLTIKGNKAILVPTKGQKEQLYLAELHANHKKWKFVERLKEGSNY